MNFAGWIPPVVAIAIAVGWIGSRKAEVERIEEQSVVLSAKIERARLRVEGKEAGRREKIGEGSDEIDWKEVAGWLDSMERGTTDMRAMMEFQKLLMEMDTDAILAALDEIEGLDLGAKLKQRLENMLIGRLIEDDPAMALQRFGDRLREVSGSLNWQLSHGFSKWLKDDPAAAGAWYETELAKGTFASRSLDGRSESFLRFESTMLKHLISHDLAAARDRLEAIPEESRMEMFGQPSLVDGMSREGMTELIKEFVPEGEQGALFSNHASHLRNQGGLEKVSEYLEGIDASPVVREDVVAQIARQEWLSNGSQDREKLDLVRDWISEEAPESLDDITGKLLAASLNESQREKRVKLLKEIHAGGGGDELIVSFLEHQGAGDDVELVKGLAELIADPEIKEEIMKRNRVEEGGVIWGHPIEKP